MAINRAEQIARHSRIDAAVYDVLTTTLVTEVHVLCELKRRNGYFRTGWHRKKLVESLKRLNNAGVVFLGYDERQCLWVARRESIEL